MKKLNLLVLSSALILGLASCGGNNNPTTTSDQTTESASVDTTDYASLGAAAINNISASFDKWTSGITSKQSLSTESKVTDNGKEYNFAITYTVSAEAAAYLSIAEDGKTLKVTCDSEDHSFKNAVTAHASINGSEKASKSFNVKVSAKTYIDLAKVYEAKDGDTVTTRGYVEVLNKSSSIITVSAGTSSIAVYTTKADYYTSLKAGDLVEITGEVDIYSGLYELKPTALNVLDEEDESVPAPVALTVGGKTDLDDEATVQSRKGIVEGYFKSITGEHKTRKSGGEYEMVEAVVYVGSATDGWQSIKIHLESDKLTDSTLVSTWGYSYDADNKKVVWTDKKPEEGKKIKATGYMGWYNGAQLTNATLESTSDWEGDKPSAAEADMVKTTIADLNKKTAPENDVAYEVTGIYEVSGDKKYLTEATTGETILIYNLTANEGKGVVWNGLDGYNYEKDSDAATSLADLKAGEEVTLKALNAYYSYTKTSEINASLISHKASTYASYTASIEKDGDDEASVSLSKTEGLAYGDEVTVTATPGTENYVVDSVIVTDAAGTETDITDTMKFNATCVNKVKVTFKDGSVKTATDTWKISDTKDFPDGVDGTSKVDGEFTANFATNGAIKMAAKGIRTLDSGATLFMTKGATFIYNTVAFPKAILSVKLTTSAGAAESAKYAVTFGTSPLSTQNTSGAVNIGKKSSGTIDCKVENATYFQIAVDTTANGQIVSVEISYTE